MSAAELMRTARAHLLVLCLCLGLVAVGAAGVYLAVPVKYEAKTQMVLLSPSNQRDPKGDFVPVNPFLLAGDRAAQVTASAMSSIASSKRFQDDLAAAGATSQMAVAVSTGGGGVVLDVSAINGKADSARHDLATMRDKLDSYLRDRQIEAGSPESQLYRFADLIGDDAATQLPGDRSKLAMVAAALGLALTILVVVILHGRDRRRAGADEESGVPDAAAAEPAVPNAGPPRIDLPRPPSAAPRPAPHPAAPTPGGQRVDSPTNRLGPVVPGRPNAAPPQPRPRPATPPDLVRGRRPAPQDATKTREPEAAPNNGQGRPAAVLDRQAPPNGSTGA